jgi:hypothetical protein
MACQSSDACGINQSSRPDGLSDRSRALRTSLLRHCRRPADGGLQPTHISRSAFERSLLSRAEVLKSRIYCGEFGQSTIARSHEVLNLVMWKRNISGGPLRALSAEAGKHNKSSGGSKVTHVLASISGLLSLFMILRSMIRIALMNCHYRDLIARLTGRVVYTAATLRIGRNRDPRTVHSALLWFFPTYILTLITVYFVGAMTAFMLLYWGTHAVSTWPKAVIASGSALNTLGFATPTSVIGQWLAIPEGALGLGIVVFLFTFIPSYQAVIRSREDKTSWLYVRVGDQPTGVTVLEWCQRTHAIGNMREIWEAWEDWFRMLGDTHSVLPMLSLSPSVQSGQSWVLAAAAVIDAAALAASSIETEDVEAAMICVRTGTRALLAIADALGGRNPAAQHGQFRPSKEGYEVARTRLNSAGIPLRSTAGVESQWQEFLSLHERYEDALFFVARKTFTPMDGVLLNMVKTRAERSAKRSNRASTSVSQA